VKERWANRDPELVAGMQELGRYADEAVTALEAHNFSRLGHLMESNFAMRRKLYSDAVVGEKNIEMAMKLSQLGLSVKFTGSGGAFIGLRKDNGGWFSEEEEQKIREELNTCHFEFLRIEIP
jgi:glucuronokinase